MSENRKIAVFIASPGDLAAERRAFRKRVNLLNKGFGEGAQVEFQALGWEDILASTGRRNQEVINAEIDRCDVFILTLHTHWGQEAPDSPYSSYTEEEFHRALDRFDKYGCPEIFVILKRIEAARMADPGPQLEKVLTFRANLAQTPNVFYREYKTANDFAEEVEKHLKKFAIGNLANANHMKQKVILLSTKLTRAVEQAKAMVCRELIQARSGDKQSGTDKRPTKLAEAERKHSDLELAIDAAAKAHSGNVEMARQIFARITVSTSNLDILRLAENFYRQTGEEESLEHILQRVIEINEQINRRDDLSVAYLKLGEIHFANDELDDAEDMYCRALEINSANDSQIGMARSYERLAMVAQERPNPKLTQRLCTEARELYQRLGMPEDVERMDKWLIFLMGE